MKKISVIVPIYNSEKYIRRCIESIINQTYKELEIILINDGSTDNSLDIISEYKKNDSRIVVINQKNSGVAFSRNKGLNVSKGEYLMFMDNDDYIDLDYIEKMYDLIGNNDIVVSGYKRVTDNKILQKKVIKNMHFGIYENVAPWGKLISKKFLVKNKISFFDYPIGEDVIFNLNLYSVTTKIVISTSTGYNWYFNNNSVSNTRQRKFDKNILNLYHEMRKYDANIFSNYFIGRYYIWYLLFSGRNNKSNSFVDEYRKIKKWLIENKYNKSISVVKIIKNETTLKNKIIVLLFYLIEKLKLIGLFSKVYCKG